MKGYTQSYSIPYPDSLSIIFVFSILDTKLCANKETKQVPWYFYIYILKHTNVLHYITIYKKKKVVIKK